MTGIFLRGKENIMKNLFSNKSSKKTKIAIAALSVCALALAVVLSTQFMAIDATIQSLMNSIKTGLQSIYAGFLGIVTVLAVVIVAWCFIVKMYSKNPRSIDEATQWMKRVCIAWLCFMLISVFIKIGLDLVTTSGANTATPWA